MMAYAMSKTLTVIAVLQFLEARQRRLDDPTERHPGSLQTVQVGRHDLAANLA